MLAPVTPIRQVAEAPEPSVAKVDPVEAREVPAAAVGIDAAPANTLQGAAPEKLQNSGNRFVRALGKVNPFRRRPKHDTVEAGKRSLKKD